MKSNVPGTLNKEAWGNQTVVKLEEELQKVMAFPEQKLNIN